MIDIETTGVDLAKDQIMQIGFLELDFDGRYWMPNRSFGRFLKINREPSSEFALKNQKEVYAYCQKLPEYTPYDIRKEILGFFNLCGVKPPSEVFLAGQNQIGFDVALLTRDGFLQRSRHETIDGKDQMVGDFHYRQYDLTTLIETVEDLTLIPRKDLIDEAIELGLTVTKVVDGSPHEALYDCYRQTALWNGLLMFIRNVSSL